MVVVVAVITPNLDVAGAFQEHADARADQHGARAVHVAADKPFLGRLKQHPAGADVVALKDLRPG